MGDPDPPGAAVAPPSPGFKPRTLAALALSCALVPLNSTMLAVALPAMARDFGAEVADLTPWLVSGYLLACIVCQGPAGALGDRVGYGRALRIGQLVMGAGAVLGFVGHALAPLTLARVLMAAGGATMVPSAMALARLRLPPDARGRAFGAFGAVMGLAAAAGPLVGGELVRRFGWPSAFLVNAPLLVTAAACARGDLDPPPRADAPPTAPARFDALGSGLLAIALGALVLAAKASGPRGIGLGAVALVGGVAFVAWERRAASPVVDFALFRARPYAAGAAIVGLQNLAMYALLFEIPAYLHDALGTGPRDAGLALIAMMGAMVVGSPLGGRLGPRFGARAVAVAGAATTTAALVAVALLRPTSPASWAAPLALAGLGLGVCTPVSQAAAMGAAPPDRSGRAAAVLAITRYLGGVLGVGALGAMLAVRPVVDAHTSVVLGFAAATALSALAAAALPAIGGSARPAR